MATNATQHRNGRAANGQFVAGNRPRNGSRKAKAVPNRSKLPRATEHSSALLIGVGVGLTAYYFFGKGGEARRRQLAELGRGTVHGLAARSNHALASLQSTAADVTDNVSSGVNSAHKSASGLQSLLMSKAASAFKNVKHLTDVDLVNSAKDRAGKLQQFLQMRADAVKNDARSKKKEWVNRASLALGRDRDHHYVGQTACALGSLALGAAAFWMFDPRLGRSRRAWMGQKTEHLGHELADFFRKTGRSVGAKFSTRVARTKHQFSSSAPVDDERLVARIRAELGHITSDALELTVDARDGWVSLGGSAVGSEISTIANFVLGIRGVRGLDNGIRATANAGS